MAAKRRVIRMMGRLPAEFIDEVRARFDIVEVVSQYVQLKRSGRNYFGLCPFHNEKTPSFSVSQEKQIFHCFGCGEGGNVYTFLMKIEGLTFTEVVLELARRAGVPLPRQQDTPWERKKLRARERLYKIMELAHDYYQYQLQQPAGRKALEYLYRRGLKPEIIKQFGLGYAPDSWHAVKNLLMKKGFTEKELLTVGLLGESSGRTYDRFRNRIIFPIHDQSGQVIAFGGRTLGDGQPKYLNSPETPLFNKSKTLYALHLARQAVRQQNSVIIFEGYMDVIAAHQAGINHAVATLGTSLTETQARILRNQAEEVIIVYDADAAGQAATWRGLEILRHAGCLVKVGRLPQGLDPDDYLGRYGAETFQSKIINHALLLTDYQLLRLTEIYNPENDKERLLLYRRIIEILNSIDNAMEQEDYLQKTAKLLNLPAEVIRQELEKAKRSSPQTRPLRKINTVPQVSTLQKALLQILALWAQYPQFIADTKEQLQAEDIPQEFKTPLKTAAAAGAELTPAMLYDVLPAEKYRLLTSRLFVHEELDEKSARKALDDCIRYVKCARIAKRRKEIEEQISKLDAGTAKGEIAKLSKEWLALRKMEEEINQAREGGKGVG